MFFEYFTVKKKLAPLTEDGLNAYGMDRWELVGFTVDRDYEFHYVFKRSLLP